MMKLIAVIILVCFCLTGLVCVSAQEDELKKAEGGGDDLKGPYTPEELADFEQRGEQAGMDEEKLEPLLKEKILLDKTKAEIAKYFGSVIL